MFHYCKIPYIKCTFSTKFTYNGFIGRYLLLSHIVSKKLQVPPPEVQPLEWWELKPGVVNKGGQTQNNFCSKRRLRYSSKYFWLFCAFLILVSKSQNVFGKMILALLILFITLYNYFPIPNFMIKICCFNAKIFF